MNLHRPSVDFLFLSAAKFVGKDATAPLKLNKDITNISGAPQVWVVPVEGGYPRMVTNGDDPATQARWSPASDWIAVGIAPGGGLNTQVYVVKPDGTGMKLLTQGGQDNNGFDAWTEDGKQIAIDSNRDNPAARDEIFVFQALTGG